MPHFECGAFDHSATCPPAVIREAPGQGKPFPCLDFPVLRRPGAGDRPRRIRALVMDRRAWPRVFFAGHLLFQAKTYFRLARDGQDNGLDLAGP